MMSKLTPGKLYKLKRNTIQAFRWFVNVPSKAVLFVPSNKEDETTLMFLGAKESETLLSGTKFTVFKFLHCQKGIVIQQNPALSKAGGAVEFQKSFQEV